MLMNFNIRDTLYFLIIFNYLKNDEEKSLYISESYFVLKICENGTYKNFFNINLYNYKMM